MATIFPRSFRTPHLEDLVLRLISFRPHVEKYAICLMRDMTTMYRGVILERVYPERNLFLNVGSFYADADEQASSLLKDRFEQSTTVDWSVL